MSLTRFPSYYRHMHVHKSKCDRFGDFMGQKHDQGSTCLPQTAAGPVLRSLDLAAAPRIADRLSHRTRTYKQTSTNNKKQYTRQHKQYKKMLLIYTTRCNDRVSVKIIENGSKTEKLWLKQDLRAKTQLNLILRG